MESSLERFSEAPPRAFPGTSPRFPQSIRTSTGVASEFHQKDALGIGPEIP